MIRRYGIDTSVLVRLLLHVLRSGLVSPLNGRRVLDAIGSGGGAGLVDRLIADDYTREDLDVLTLDRAMASLPRVRILQAETAWRACGGVVPSGKADVGRSRGTIRTLRISGSSYSGPGRYRVRAPG